MPRLPTEFRAVLKAADYYEPLLRMQTVRAMKVLRTRISVADVLGLMGDRIRVPKVITKRIIAEVLTPVTQIVRDAFAQGGKIGAERIRRRG